MNEWSNQKCLDNATWKLYLIQTALLQIACDVLAEEFGVTFGDGAVGFND